VQRGTRRTDRGGGVTPTKGHRTRECLLPAQAGGPQSHKGAPQTPTLTLTHTQRGPRTIQHQRVPPVPHTRRDTSSSDPHNTLEHTEGAPRTQKKKKKIVGPYGIPRGTYTPTPSLSVHFRSVTHTYDIPRPDETNLPTRIPRRRHLANLQGFEMPVKLHRPTHEPTVGGVRDRESINYPYNLECKTGFGGASQGPKTSLD